MSNLKVHAGDFQKHSATYNYGQFSFLSPLGVWSKVRYSVADIEDLDKASEESVKRLGGTIGWGVAGGVLLGGVGLLAGLLAGGKGTDVHFVVKFNDGKKALCSLDSKSFTDLSGRLMDANSMRDRLAALEPPKISDEEWQRSQDEEWQRIMNGEGVIDQERKAKGQNVDFEIERGRNRGGYP